MLRCQRGQFEIPVGVYRLGEAYPLRDNALIAAAETTEETAHGNLKKKSVNMAAVYVTPYIP